MRKRLFGILIAITFLLFAAAAHASPDDVLGAMAKKLHRGMINILTGWVEFPAQIVKGYNYGFMGNEKNKLAGIMAGTINGVTHSLGRTLSGVADVVGFWAANPEDNEDVGLHLDAEYPWEESEPYEMLKPSFADATLSPIVNKLFRGSGNTLFGFMEFPTQITKGYKEKMVDLGIFKGLWYWLSREISGISDIVTVILPTPEDPGDMPFNEEFAWDSPVY